MAAWLSQWLRDIVLIVLFAAFVDLLVPNNALQKYVKITISLMILLTILSPIIGMLRPDLDIREAAYDAMQADPGNMGTLSEVLEAGGRLRLEAESRTARLAEAQIADQIRQQVVRMFPVTVRAVDVRFGPGEAEGTAEILTVRLELQPLDDGQEDGGSVDGELRVSGVPSTDFADPAGETGAVTPVSPIGPIAPVAPVSIVLSDGDGARETATGTGVGKEREPSAEEARLAADIAVQVGRWWSLDAERIEVVWRGREPAE